MPDPEGSAEPGPDPSHVDVSMPLTRRHPMLLSGLVLVGFVVAGALAALLVTSLSFPGSPALEWQLGDLDPTLAQTTTEIPIGIDQWPSEDCYAPEDSWLAAPKVTYTPWSVIITMHPIDSYDPANCRGFYTTNWSGTVPLSEPLGGRSLLDGSAFPPAARPLRSAIANLQIIAISDWRGQLDPIAGIGGAAVLSAYFDQERADRSRGGAIVTLSTGNDVGSSHPLSTFFQDTPAIVSERMMGVTVSSLGNHNFDAGIGRLQSQIDLAFADASDGDSRFHYVASNLSERDANLEDVEDYEILLIGDAKFAFIGVLSEKSPEPAAPGSLGTMTRTDSAAAAMAARAAAKAAGADAFIAITDKGVTGSTGSEPTGELVDFANAVSGFDVIFGGGTDVQFSGTINGQLVVENRSRGMTYSKTYLTYDRLAARMTASSNTFVIPTAASVTPDPRVVAMLGTYQGQMSLLQDGTPGIALPAPAPPTSTLTKDKSAACLATTSLVPAYAQRLARDIASLRPLVVAERFDPVTAADALRRVDETLTAYDEINPPYHGCALSNGYSHEVGHLVARAAHTMKKSEATGVVNANQQRRVVLRLYAYLPEALALVYAPAPYPPSVAAP